MPQVQPVAFYYAAGKSFNYIYSKSHALRDHGRSQANDNRAARCGCDSNIKIALYIHCVILNLIFIFAAVHIFDFYVPYNYRRRLSS